MSEGRFDAAVVGAGPVGLAAALALSGMGLRTILIGPVPERRDGRTAALLRGSVDLLAGLGIWPALQEEAGALRAIRLVDATDSLFRPPPVTFRASEIGLDAFGWNVENARLSEVMAQAVGRAEIARREALVGGFAATDETAQLLLADGSSIEASLVVAADGRSSRVRRQAGIAVRERRYPQAAFTVVLRHERDHDGVSTEFHTRNGPVTLVPLPGRRSSLVWVTLPRHAARLMEVDEANLAQAVEGAVRSLLGRMEVAGPRGTVPLASLSAERLVSHRLALAGEAAHVLPPIGAQGLNLGFADVSALASSLRASGRDGRIDPGRDGVLSRYARARRLDTRVRSLAVDGLNRILLSDLPPLDAVRGLGLGLVGHVGPLRRAVMRAGLPVNPAARSVVDATSG